MRNRLKQLLGFVSGLAYRVPAVQRRWASRFQSLEFGQVPWTPLTKPLAECRVSLVTTGGVHLKWDVPFDMHDSNGDPSFREIPVSSPREALTITHRYYDHRAADRDINVVLPLDVLDWMQGQGRIGGVAASCYSLMGHILGPHLNTLRARTAPELAARLTADGVDVAIFTPA